MPSKKPQAVKSVAIVLAENSPYPRRDGNGKRTKNKQSVTTLIRRNVELLPLHACLLFLQVECLGACVNAPMIQVNDDYYVSTILFVY
ncbi:hypothetical protein RR48_00185 [Papilio machaon]|uniref:Uncharacterized protein n=1 Tax=Papilio machaon TaxID=76193 RepID=A0A0N0PFT9_PAPMA|nr:hypothetical protein RR48_00185 [Papilio machaon]